MTPLTPLHTADERHLMAAEGWLDLGDCQSANDELEAITPEMRAYPDVLTMRVKAYLAAKKRKLVLENNYREKLPVSLES